MMALLFDLSGQINKYGVPFITNYPTQMTPGSEQNWCIEKDVFGNMYFGNQDRGVIRYDGTKWSSVKIKNNPRLYSLKSDDRGIVYLGASYEFGYIQPSVNGSPEYVSLAERLDSISEIRNIFCIQVMDKKVFFQSPWFIYVYEIESDSLTRISLNEYGLTDTKWMGLVSGRMIIYDNGKGFFELKGEKVVPLPGGENIKDKSWISVLQYDDNQIIICTFSDGIYLYNYNTGAISNTFIDKRLNEKLKNVFVYAAAKISDDLFAVGTINTEGVLIINKSGELVRQISRDNSDLADNTIYAMYCDYKNKGELWISALGVISKVYFNIPLTRFSGKQGIESGLNDICEFNGSIYLSTDGGILKSTVDRDNNSLVFKPVPGTTAQVLPLEVIKSVKGSFLLAGSREGVYSIDANDVFRKVERNCRGLANLKTNFITNKILQSSSNENIVYLGLDAGGIVILRNDGPYWTFINRIKGISGIIIGMVEKPEGGMWILTDDLPTLFNMVITGSDTTLVKYGTDKGVPDAEMNSIHLINNELYIATPAGLIRYDKSTDRFTPDNRITKGVSEGKYVQNLFLDNDGDLWLSGMDQAYYEMLFTKEAPFSDGYRGVLNILPSVSTLDIMELNGIVYMTKSKVVSVVDKSKFVRDTSHVNTMFVSIIVGNDSIVLAGAFPREIGKNRRLPERINPSASIPVYGYDMNEITFEWTTPYYNEEFRTEYSYMLEGYDENWSKWEGVSFGYSTEALYPRKEYFNLPYGHYTFKVRARTLTGLEGKNLEFEFMIAKPWYATIVAFFGFALVAILIIYGIIAAYTRRLKSENIRLEGIVAERTAVVVKQKEELESSIHYASRIQMALLPSEAILSENIKNYFVLFKPRDIVSGDFYWMTKKGERLYIVAADCTGHGVPGAFMSLLGMSFLDEIIDKEMAPRADFILKELRLHVTDSLKQSGGDDEAKDGMDMALLVIDFNTNKIEFSGAYNPCFRVRKLTDSEVSKYKDDSGELPDGSMSNGRYLLETIYASKMPIGISSRMNEEFVFFDWALERGVSYYLFSDGYIDQFGGPNGRKFMKKNFKRLILDIQDYPMSKQKELLDQNLNEWMGQSPQIDDILVMGIRTE
jgi:serine phosphatase RsbU (regulator of sigma subunit)/ligand-binding sensor domain-containing protein